MENRKLEELLKKQQKIFSGKGTWREEPINPNAQEAIREIERLEQLLYQRDAFIVGIGQWDNFVDSITFRENFRDD